MKKNENTATTATTKAVETKAVDWRATLKFPGNDDIKKGQTMIDEGKTAKDHQKQSRGYQLRGRGEDANNIELLTAYIGSLKLELPEDVQTALNGLNGLMKHTAGGGGVNLFDSYFSGLDSGSALPLYLFMYMNSDGSKIGNAHNKNDIVTGILAGTIKERMNLVQLGKKLEELKLTDKYKVEGEFLKKIQ